MTDLTIFPVFPHTIAVCSLQDSEVDDNALEHVRKLEYVGTSFDEAHSRSASSTHYSVLDGLPRLKQGILDRFYTLKDKYLFHTKNDFVFTASWSTKTEKGDYSKFHDHRNCYYSGVFYFDGDDQTGKIRFNNPFRRPWHIDSTRPNELNMDQMAITPYRNMVVFFPSYIEHAIQEHRSDSTRYSIAFNLMPVGLVGTDTSAAVFEIPGQIPDE